MIPIPRRGRARQNSVLALAALGLVLAAVALSQAVWATPGQMPERQTVPTRTHTLTPTAEPTFTLAPTATSTHTPTTQPTRAATNPPPTATALPATPTSALVEATVAATALPTPAQLPVSGQDWGAALLRNAGLTLTVLVAVLVVTALTFARRAPKASRER